MNVRAIAVAACVGAAFLALEYKLYYQPESINPDEIWSLFQSEHGMARAAVSRVLIAPASAHFSGLRSVEADKARYVCGSVKAIDRERQYVETAFVYTVAIDFARIDDDGRITSQRSTYRPCPTAADDKIAEQEALIPSGARSTIEAVERLIPKTSGGTMEQQLGQLAGQTAAVAPGSAVTSGSVVTSGSAGAGSAPAQQHSGSRVEATRESELTWRADHPPAAWPTFPSGHPLAKSTQKRTAAEAFAFANGIEARWEWSKSSGASMKPPSSDEIKEACRVLLAIDPASREYPEAWAAFVRLRKIDREIAA
jgi:hypothetical protein